MLPPLKPIAIKDRVSVVFVEKGQLDVLDGAFVVIDKNGVRTHIPVGGIVCLMLEPGPRVSHAAVVLASRVGCLLVWIGDGGVRLYSSGQPGGARTDRFLWLCGRRALPWTTRRGSRSAGRRTRLGEYRDGMGWERPPCLR